MWSKTLKGLNERLADSLQGRVKYQFEEIRRHEYWSKTFKILVDGEILITCNIDKYYAKAYDVVKDDKEFELSNYEDENTERCYAVFERDQYVFGKTAIGSADFIFAAIHYYLNEADMRKEFKKFVENREYVFVLFGILDRRVGKRSFEWLIDRMDQLPDPICKFINLRIEAEGWKIVN